MLMVFYDFFVEEGECGKGTKKKSSERKSHSEPNKMYLTSISTNDFQTRSGILNQQIRTHSLAETLRKI